MWMVGSGPIYGDFQDGSRGKWTADIKAAGDALIAVLESQQAANQASLALI